MKLRIISKKDGFRRAGMAHRGTRVYPAGTFSEGQIQALLAEPMLVVEFLEEQPVTGSAPARLDQSDEPEPQQDTATEIPEEKSADKPSAKKGR